MLRLGELGELPLLRGDDVRVRGDKFDFPLSPALNPRGSVGEGACDPESLPLRDAQAFLGENFAFWFMDTLNLVIVEPDISIFSISTADSSWSGVGGIDGDKNDRNRDRNYSSWTELSNNLGVTGGQFNQRPMHSDPLSQNIENLSFDSSYKQELNDVSYLKSGDSNQT